MWMLVPLLLVSTLPDDPKLALAQVDQRATVLENVRYGAVRKTEQASSTLEERWRYASEPGGKFRVDYFGDTQRQIVCDGKVLWQYIPAMREAQRYDLAQMAPDDRAALITGILERVNLPGLRTGWAAADMPTVVWEDAPSDQAESPTRTVIATDERGGRLRFELDATHGFLVAATIEQNGVFVVSTETSEHREVSPGVWFPHHVESVAPAPGGMVRVDLRVNQVAVGEDIPDALFEMKLDPSIKVTKFPDRPS